MDKEPEKKQSLPNTENHRAESERKRKVDLDEKGQKKSRKENVRSKETIDAVASDDAKQYSSHESFFMFNLEPQAAEFVRQNCNSETEIFAITGPSTVIIIESDEMWMGREIPAELSEKLTAFEKSTPAYVSLGSMNRWYIEFADGSCEWKGCEDMDEELRDLETSDEKPCWVAFGEHWDSYFIIYDSGEWCFSNIPDPLDELIKNLRAKSATGVELICVSLGPSGEYYLSASDGTGLRNHYGGMTLKQMEEITPIKDRIVFLDFGENGTYMARYD